MTRIVRIARTDESLREASKAVDYDLNMMGNTLQATMLQSHVGIGSSPEEHLVADAMLHSFLLATRNLCKFLHSHKPYANDIIAEDFFDDSDDWKKLHPRNQQSIRLLPLADAASVCIPGTASTVPPVTAYLFTGI